MKRFIFTAVLSVFLVACGTGLARRDEPGLKYVDYAGDPVAEIRAMRGINGWTPVSRTQLVIWTGINQAWLLTVWEGCYNLTFANAIQVTRTGYTISRFEKVRVENETCAIREIRPIDVVRMKADRKAARDTTPKSKP